MIVCLCAAVSDKEIRILYKNGAKDLEKIGQICGAGTGCGSCKEDIRKILREEKALGKVSACGISPQISKIMRRN